MTWLSKINSKFRAASLGNISSLEISNIQLHFLNPIRHGGGESRPHYINFGFVSLLASDLEFFGLQRPPRQGSKIQNKSRPKSRLLVPGTKPPGQPRLWSWGPNKLRAFWAQPRQTSHASKLTLLRYYKAFTGLSPCWCPPDPIGPPTTVG